MSKFAGPALPLSDCSCLALAVEVQVQISSASASPISGRLPLPPPTHNPNPNPPTEKGSVRVSSIRDQGKVRVAHPLQSLSRTAPHGTAAPTAPQLNSTQPRRLASRTYSLSLETLPFLQTIACSQFLADRVGKSAPYRSSSAETSPRSRLSRA